MCKDEDPFFHSSTKPESGLPLQNLAAPKNSISLKASSTTLTGYGKLNKTGEVLGFNVFDEIVIVLSSDALKAIDKVTLGRQTSCSPTLHKHNGVMEAITHCGGSLRMLSRCESKFIDVTRPFIYKDMGNDTVS